MVLVTIRLIGEDEDKVFDHIELNPQIDVGALRKLIETLTRIPASYQQIRFRGERLKNSLYPLELITDFEELVVSHHMLPSWRAYIQMIEEIRGMTTSGVMVGRREIALKARIQLSPLFSSGFFSTYPCLAIEEVQISKNLNFLIHNTKKYLDRSVLVYFKALYPERKVELKEKSEDFAGVHLGVFVLVDDVACYYAKTLGSIPGPDEEIEFPNCPTIDLLEIFVYFLLKLIGLGPVEVHVIPDINNSKLVFIATKLIDGFRTASGVSATQMLENSSSEGKVVIDTEMRRQMKILSSLLCLSDLQRNKGNHGIVEQQPTEVEKEEGKVGPTYELRIVDFGVNLGYIGCEPTIMSSTSDIPFLKPYFEKWDILNNIYKAREAMKNDPAIENNKNVNQRKFEQYFERLEGALRKFLEK